MGTQKNLANQFSMKKCRDCSTDNTLAADVCVSCKKKLGDVDVQGYAIRPFDYKAYAVGIASVIVFVVYMWWAFFREA